eukprot:c16570_g1_i1 orf=251-1510(+)
MEMDLALGSSSGLNTTTVRASQLLNGGRQGGPSCGVWLPRKQSLNGKVFQKRWCEMPKAGKQGRRHCVVKADMTASATTTPVAPLLLESPSGQFLAELLQSHPHLVSAAAEQQLETLAEARDAATSQEQSSSAASEMILFKRIADLRAQERCKSLEDIMYALISQKFVEAGISFVPQIPTCSRNQRVDTWPPQDMELESVHSDAALELIREHLSLVLGGRGRSDQNATAQISKLRMGRVYAASAVYGYFISRVDKRFQLEKTIANSTAHCIEVEQTCVQENKTDHKDEELVSEGVPAVTALAVRSESQEVESIHRASRKVVSSGRLRTYVMSFDQKTLQRYATVRSKESVSVIERHTEALFGKPEIKITPEGTVAIAKDEIMMLSFSGLRRLVLEAVAFGSFLWDVETHVDTHYHFVAR